MTVVNDFGNNIEFTEEEKAFNNKVLNMMIEPKESFKLLLEYKNKIRKEVYGFLARAIYKMNTRGVDKELMVEVFDYFDKKYFMTDDEYKKYQELPKRVVIFRGTDNGEKEPKLSWTLNPDLAFNYYVMKMHSGIGQLFTGIVDRDFEIFAVFNDNEEEVVANVSCYSSINFMI